MIVKETYNFKDGRVGTRTYSDKNVLIRKKGTTEEYAEAIDILPFEYEETETPIPQEPEEIVEE